MRREITLAVLLAVLLLPRLAHSQGINPVPLIIQDESGGNPTAQSNLSTASGLGGIINGTWAAALAACGGACGTTAQFPTAASAPASVQTAAIDALINSQGLQPWLCNGCDARFAAQVAAAGGPGAFQTSGLDTNPADFASLDTSAGLLAFLNGGTPLASGGIGIAAALDPALGSGGDQTIVTDQPGTSPGPGGGILDTIASYFQNASGGWQGALFTIAISLFWILALIDLLASLIYLFVGGGRPDWIDVVLTVLRWLFPVGIFSWLMLHASEYTGDIINGLRLAGGAIGSYALTPSAVFAAGINTVTTIWNNYHGFWGTLDMIPVMIADVPIVIAFALAAVWMLVILIESYFVIGLAVLLLAFGGMHWSRNIAVSLLFSCVAVGFKLLAIEAIAPTATAIIMQIAQNSAGLSFQGIFTTIGAGIAFAAVAKVIPDRIERIVLGHGYSLVHPQQFVREAAGAGAFLAGGVALTGGSVALAMQSLRFAQQQLTQSGQQGGQIAPPRLQLVSSALGAAASAAGAEISGRLGGLYRGGAGAAAVRMAGNVGQQRRVAAAQAARPQPPTGNSP